MNNGNHAINRPTTSPLSYLSLDQGQTIDLEALDLLERSNPPFGNIAWNLYIKSTMPLPLWLVSNIIHPDPRGISQGDLVAALVRMANLLRHLPRHPDRRQEYLKIDRTLYAPRHLRPYPT